MTRGVISTTVSLLRTLSSLLENNQPTTGTSLRPGTPLRRRVVLFLIRPPIRIDWPSSASSWVVTSVLFLDGMPSASEPELTSGWIFIRIRPRWSTEGTTLRITPVSRYCTLSVVTRFIVVVTL